MSKNEIEQFESSVNSEGIEAILEVVASDQEFESSVNSEGIEATTGISGISMFV